MAAELLDKTWMWHPTFSEERTDSAGLLVHFRRSLTIENDPPKSLHLSVTADTRYKFFVNKHLLSFGPVKGDQNLWFYDTVDIGPYLKCGENHIRVVVLRFFYATTYAPSFPRLPSGGLRIESKDQNVLLGKQLESSTLWETAVDPSTVFRVDEPEDDFLHIYERVSRTECHVLKWVPARLLEYQSSTGIAPPWHLSPRIIPTMRLKRTEFCNIHNISSKISKEKWAAKLVNSSHSPKSMTGLCLPARTSHKIQLEVEHHMTCFIRFRFRRPQTSGSTMMITYAECYEEEPTRAPYLRNKKYRCDDTKNLYGPKDIYEFEGMTTSETLGYYEDEDIDEMFVPFHFRTFRFLQLEIDVGSSDLILQDLTIDMANYPLDIHADLQLSFEDDTSSQLWNTSIRTLHNCMHDCYEDCPFYEQLQYAMDTRSSALFTYYVSGDDRLARQAIIQIHNSFQARLSLTASRSPSHTSQIIPHFSLFWICMLCDHMWFFGDKVFVSQFLSVVDAVLHYFQSRVDFELGLVVSDFQPGIWNFVDWTEQWRPYGIPPTVEKSGISTYTNNLYAYTLMNACQLLDSLGRSSQAEDYKLRATNIVNAIRRHCFDGRFFTDSLSSIADTSLDYSQHNQVWSVLSGAATVIQAHEILLKSLDSSENNCFVKTSLSMSFYTLRALTKAGGTIYDQLFHKFWEPWRSQLMLGLTTWEEDNVSQRSDCHAWGSAPIYEYMAEVAGIRPAKPGWASLEFSPRFNLYREFEATIPMKLVGGEITGYSHVSWIHMSNGSVEINLRVEIMAKKVIPVYVKLASQPLRSMKSTDDFCFVVKTPKSIECKIW
ncbi:bacterial alpha-L-rhamnosidase-domain-containing protein [Dipodascopsis uninucleata]